MPGIRHALGLGALLGFALAVAAPDAAARQGELPYSLRQNAKLARVLPLAELAPLDAAMRRLEIDTAAAASLGARTKRTAVADPRTVSLTPQRDGVWDSLADGSQLWRVQVRAAGATDLRLAFDRYALPAGATLYVIGADGYYQGPYTADDGHGQFHAPVVPGDTATVELRVPAAAWPLADDALQLSRVGAGFRDAFGREPIDLVKLGSPGPLGRVQRQRGLPARRARTATRSARSPITSTSTTSSRATTSAPAPCSTTPRATAGTCS